LNNLLLPEVSGMSYDKDIKPEEQLGIPTEEIPEEVGSVKVADEVISIVAGLAAIEVPGVADMSGGIKGGINDMLGKQNFSKGIKVTANGKNVVIDVYVYIKYGASIPDVAIALQEKVKEAVESMTGYEVTSVNIMVEGIRRVEEVNIDEEPTKDEDLRDEEEKQKDAEEKQKDEERLEKLEKAGNKEKYEEASKDTEQVETKMEDTNNEHT
jgi:uncharacterized alkaline shock family protein YloU